MQHYLLRLEAPEQAAPLSPETLANELRLPDGWRLISTRSLDGERAVGEIFSYALLLWPAVSGLFLLGAEGWQLAAKVALALWLGLLHLVAYRGAGGRYLGNSLLMLSGCVAAFWWTHPGGWMVLWLVVIVIGVYASVRGVLRR